MIDLHIIWYLLLGILIAGYAVFDGFDLGVGILSLFARTPHERHTHARTIDIVWDLNQVWLLTAGGAIFAAFPFVYGAVFSGFYLAFMLLLFSLIARAVSIEFRNKIDDPRWQAIWDWAFGIGSLIPAILFGVAFGNILRGLPIDVNGVFRGNFFTLLNPYALMVGVLSTVMFTMHGAIYMTLKTSGELQERIRRWALRLWMAFGVIYIIATAVSIMTVPVLFRGIASNPLFYAALLLIVAGIPAIPSFLKKHRFGLAFLASCSTIFGMIALAGVSMFPVLVPSTINLQYSLTIYNASASKLTLTIMLGVALVGMPLVLAYTAYFYWLFRGKIAHSAPEAY